MTKKSNTLIVDCQIFQTFSWQRGMGKYSLELMKAVLARNKHQKVYLLFNSSKDPNKEAREILSKIVPDVNFLDIDLYAPKEPREDYSVESTRSKNKKILSNYIRNNFNDHGDRPNFLILSLYLDEVCSVFPDKQFVGDNLLLYYDSIPYLYHERYGAFKNFFEHYYLPHTATVFEATKVLTISKTVANDLRLYFGVQAERIFSIDGAPIPRKANKPTRPSNWTYEPGSFVLMPTGQELRKNNLRATQAFADFITKTQDGLSLIITSHFSDEGKEELKSITDKVDFSGSVSEGELLWLYQNCKFVLFPSEYEGLGLPILEAVDENKVIACSNIPVFREMSKDAFYYFDPKDVGSISEVIKEANVAVDEGITRDEAYKMVSKKYTWERTAELFTDALGAEVKVPVVEKKKIAVFCPDPSGFSAIGKDIGELHAWYSTYFDVDYYFDKGPNHRELRPNILKYAANCYSAEDFTSSDVDNYDALVYHVGNSEYHLNIIRNALVYPGYMILHDTDLSGAFNNLVELGYISAQRYRIELTLEEKLKAKKNSDRSKFVASLINNQHAVITHSKYAESAVKAKVVDGRRVRVKMLELPFDVPVFPELLARAQNSQISIAFAGIIAKIKGIDVMETIAMSEEFADCKINIFGLSAVDTDQLKKLRQLPNVNIATNISDFEFQQLLMESDVMVNVRLAYRGETSGSTLSHMRYGGVGIIRDFGWFSELPDDVVVKVQTPDDAIEALRQLITNPNELNDRSVSALKFMTERHSHDAYSKGMYDLINNN